MTERPPYLQALGAAAALLALYAITLAPTTWFWDTSEYIATAHILGIPHPPGNPLFVVIGKVWSLLLAPTGLSMAVRMNLFAAVTSAAATGFFFLVTHRVLAGWLGAARTEGTTGSEVPLLARLPLIGAWAGAILAGTAFTVWNQSNVNEKVYTLSVLVIAAVSWLAIRWLDRKDEEGSGWLLVLAGYLMVLGSTNHLMSLLPGPALLLLVLVEKPSIFGDSRFLVRSAAAVFLGLSFNFFLPIRSELQPVINEGEPVCDSMVEAAVAVYSLGKAGCDALAANLAREQYGKPSIFEDPTVRPPAPAEARGAGLMAHQLLNYFQYFDWQWARGADVSSLPGTIYRLPFTLVFLGLGLWGIAVAARSRRGHLVYLGVLALTLTFGLVYYLNFKYGYSLAPPEIGLEMREVRERDYFFIASFHLWGFLAGMGLIAAWRWSAGGREATPKSFRVTSALLVLVFVPLAFNWSWASRRGDYSARDWAYNMLMSVEPYSILFTNGDNDTFPLWYLQVTEGIRQDVTVIVGQYLHTDWYPRQLRLHTSPDRQQPFRPEEAGGIYHEGTPPTRAITYASDDDLNRVPRTPVQLPEDVTLNLGGLAVQYPAGHQFLRADQIALAFIQDSMNDRPIYFASTGGMARDLGLGSWVVKQGLASKLWHENPANSPGVVRTSPNIGGEWIDFERTLHLADSVFSYRGLEEREVWADRATLNIPWHFFYLHLQLAEAAVRAEGDRELANRLVARAERFGITATGGSEAQEGSSGELGIPVDLVDPDPLPEEDSGTMVDTTEPAG